jgi:predicted dinucleotide-binding enzyme
MNITVIGRGNVGGGLARFWRAAGHEVQELGRDGETRRMRTSCSSRCPAPRSRTRSAV